MDIPFQDWKPDLGDINASLMIADGVLPTAAGWAPYPALYVPSGSAALPSAPRGLISIVLNSNAWQAYAFTASALYILGSDYTWTLIASGYNLTSNYDWSALHFGTKLLFTNTTDGLKAYDVETPAGVSSVSDAGAPAWIFTCANFIIALNCLDANGVRNARLIKTSGFNDYTNWKTDGADYQELADGENLLCGFDLKNNTALLVQQHALVLMQFGNVGGGAQFSLQKVSDGRGAVAARSCVSFDGMVFGIATDGFWRFDMANGLQFIGDEVVDKTFLAALDQTYFQLVQAAVDPLRKVVSWRYKRGNDTSLTVTEVTINYHWTLNRFFSTTEQLSALTRLATVAVTYDAAVGTYDSQTLTYDDLFFTGSAPLFGGLDGSYKFGLRTGTNLAATFTTGLRDMPVTGLLTWVTPVIDSASLTVELGVKDTFNSSITFKTAASKVTSGRVPLRGRGTKFQFRTNIPAAYAWSYANGLDHLVIESGGVR